ncbi:MAG: hypothetical protein WCJ64_02025 [Rhodospirillaceae bacterium]
MRVVIMMTFFYLLAGMAHQAQTIAAERLSDQANQAQQEVPAPVVVAGVIVVAER